MIAPIKKAKQKTKIPAWHKPYLAMLSQIRHWANIRLQNKRGEARQDAMAEVLAFTAVAFARLVERGKADVAPFGLG